MDRLCVCLVSLVLSLADTLKYEWYLIMVDNRDLFPTSRVAFERFRNAEIAVTITQFFKKSHYSPPQGDQEASCSKHAAGQDNKNVRNL